MQALELFPGHGPGSRAQCRHFASHTIIVTGGRECSDEGAQVAALPQVGLAHVLRHATLGLSLPYI